MVSIVSVIIVMLAYAFGGYLPTDALPVIAVDSLERFLGVLAGSLLAVATFAVSSMVSAYASASRTATPRSFDLVIADDSSQNALSVFIGVFIYSVISLIAVKNQVFSQGGLFVIFLVTIFGFCLVIWVFISWVDDIARLGRLGATIRLIEQETQKHIQAKLLTELPRLFEVTQTAQHDITAGKLGHIQDIHHAKLQAWCDKHHAYAHILCHIGDYVYFDTPIIRLYLPANAAATVSDEQASGLQSMLDVERNRLFKDNPKFGLEVLTEIAARALSPAVNDNGSAIEVIRAQTRLLLKRSKLRENPDLIDLSRYNRLQHDTQPESEFLHAAFYEIALYGSNNINVMLTLVESLHAMYRHSQYEVFKHAIVEMLHQINTLVEINMPTHADTHSVKQAITNTGMLYVNTGNHINDTDKNNINDVGSIAKSE